MAGGQERMERGDKKWSPHHHIMWEMSDSGVRRDEGGGGGGGGSGEGGGGEVAGVSLVGVN